MDRSGSVSLQSNAREVVPSRYGGGLTPPGFKYPASTPNYKSALGKDSSDNEKNVTAVKDQPTSKASNFSTLSSSEAKSTGRWVPPSLSQDVKDRNEIIFRRVRGLLNKLTPEKFDKLYFDLINVGIDSKTILKGIIILIFEKATSEPKYSSLYAQLCLRLSHAAPHFDDPAGSGSSTFRKLLLNRCQDEFASRSKGSAAFEKQEEYLSEEQEEEKNLSKRKMLGNIKFICELGKLGMVHEATLHKCIQQLLARKKGNTAADMAEDIECLCQIMGTVGKILDVPKAKNIMDQYFSRIQHLTEMYDFPARIKFMLKDLLELREHDWVPRRAAVLDSGPRSVSQMRWEAYGPQAAGMPSMRLPFPPGSVPPMFPMPPMPMPPFANMKPDWFGDPIHGTPPLVPPPPPPAMFQHMMRGVVPPPREPEMDIFGKETTGKTPQLMAKLQKKEDLFEPHYLKSSITEKSSPSSSPQLVPTQRNVMQPFGMPPAQPPPQPSTRKFDLFDDEDYKDFLKPTVPDLTPWSRGSFENSTPTPEPTVPVTSIGHMSVNGQQSNSLSFASKASSTPPESRPLMAFSKVKPKKNEEISLRPMSFRTQKKEDPKKEEKPGKVQPESEKSKPKKGTLTKAEYEKRLDGSLQEFLENPDVTNLGSFKEILTTTKYAKMAAVKLIKNTAYRDSADWKNIYILVVALWKENLITKENITDALNQASDDIKFNDQKHCPAYLSSLCAELISEEAYALKDFAALCENGKFDPAFSTCCVKITEIKGQDWLSDMYKEEKVNFMKTLPVDQQANEYLMEVAESKGLQFLFPALYLQAELLNILKTESNTNSVYKWIKERIEPIITDEKSFVFTLVTSVLKYATSDSTLASDLDTTQMPERDLQDKEKEGVKKMENLLRKYLDSKPHLQVEALYTMQVFCYDNGFPKGMLLRFFILFYDREIIEEDAYMKWKEDINDSYPGKGKALFQVNNWLQWLETADDEEESEDDD